jgi:transposase InsO family protein
LDLPGRGPRRLLEDDRRLQWQYVSLAFGQKARDAGIAISMGSRGDCFDNAVAESFFATLKKELVRRRSWPDRRGLQSAVFDYIESVYNRERRTPHWVISPSTNRRTESQALTCRSKRGQAKVPSDLALL